MEVRWLLPDNKHVWKVKVPVDEGEPNVKLIRQESFFTVSNSCWRIRSDTRYMTGRFG